MFICHVYFFALATHRIVTARSLSFSQESNAPKCPVMHVSIISWSGVMKRLDFSVIFTASLFRDFMRFTLRAKTQISRHLVEPSRHVQRTEPVFCEVLSSTTLLIESAQLSPHIQLTLFERKYSFYWCVYCRCVYTRLGEKLTKNSARTKFIDLHSPLSREINWAAKIPRAIASARRNNFEKGNPVTKLFVTNKPKTNPQ